MIMDYCLLDRYISLRQTDLRVFTIVFNGINGEVRIEELHNDATHVYAIKNHNT